MRPVTLQERVHSSQPPEEWRLSKLHHVFTVRSRNKNTGMQEDNLLSLSFGQIKRKDIAGADGLLPESFETYQIVEPGDVVLRLTDLQNDKRSLRQGLVTERGIITSAYDAVRVGTEHEPRFWFYALYALDLAKYYYSMGGGVRQSIKFSDFPNDWIAAPDLPTQKAIAAFLDRETARIDQLIEKKQRLVELLGERRSGIREVEILNTSAGRSTRLKHLVQSLTTGPFGSSLKESEYEVGGVPVINPSHIGWGSLKPNPKVAVSDVKAEELSYWHLASGDVITPRRGELGRSSVVGRHEAGWVCGTGSIRIRPHRNKLSASYLQLVLSLRMSLEWLDLHAVGTTMKNLNEVILGELPVPNVGCAQEQSTVAHSIKDKEATLHKMIGMTRTSIDRLKEYRSALITAAVTGQIDVETWSRRGEGDKRLDPIQEEMAG